MSDKIEEHKKTTEEIIKVYKYNLNNNNTLSFKDV